MTEKFPKISQDNLETEGMTVEEIEKHLDLLETEEGKMKYLQTILLKGDLLEKETRKNINSIMQRYLVPKPEEPVPSYYGKDVLLFEKDKEKIIEAAKQLEEEAEIDIKNGFKDEAFGHYLNAVNLFRKAGKIDEAKRLVDIAAKNITDPKYRKTVSGDNMDAIDKALQDTLMQLGEADKIVDYYLVKGKSLDAIEKAADNLEKSGYVLQVKKLRERLNNYMKSKK
jgi:tetratricopeptide (TPR) repeat protein